MTDTEETSDFFGENTTNQQLPFPGADEVNHTSFNSICPANTTLRVFGQSFIVPRDPFVYITLAVCHMIAILIPAVVFSSLAIYFLVRKTLSKHPTNLIFLWICVICILAPCSYGLLMDLSLIFDLPLLGHCETRWEGIVIWLCYTSANTTYNMLLAFSAISFYVSLHRNIRHFSLLKLNFLLALVVVVSFIVASFWRVLAENQTTGSCKIRGSFCITYFGGRRQVAIALEVIRLACTLAPLDLSVVISLILYYKKVRSSVVNFDRAILGSILRLFVVLAGGSFVWNSPTVVVHFGSFDGTQRSFIEMLSTFTLQLNFVLFPLLTLFMHKEVRGPFMAAICCRRALSPPPVEQSTSESHKTSAAGISLGALSDPLVQMPGTSLTITNPTASLTNVPVQVSPSQHNRPPSELADVQHSSASPPLSVSAIDSDTVSPATPQPSSAAITQQPSSMELADKPVNSELSLVNPLIMAKASFDLNSEVDVEPLTTTSPLPRVPSSAAHCENLISSVTKAEVLAANVVESGASDTDVEIENGACETNITEISAANTTESGASNTDVACEITEIPAANTTESGVSGASETKVEASIIEAWGAEFPTSNPFNSGASASHSSSPPASHGGVFSEHSFTLPAVALASQVALPTGDVSDMPMGTPTGSIFLSDAAFQVIDLETSCGPLTSSSTIESNSFVLVSPSSYGLPTITTSPTSPTPSPSPTGSTIPVSQP